MFETILGGVLGGLSRLAPEVFKFIDRKADRKHELDMLAANLASDKAKLAGQLAVADSAAQSAQFTSALNALQEAVKGQGEKTGVGWVDGFSSLVRPIVTYVVFAMWVVVKLASLGTVLAHTTSLDEFSKLVILWWVPNDQAMLAAILNFWFMGRVFDKALK